MPSGARALIWNSKERVLSTDLNAPQAYTMSAVMQVLKRMLDDTQDAYDAPGNIASHSTTGNPLRAVVLGGLLVDPTLGTSVIVNPGTMVAINDTIASDSVDSRYVIVDDPGQRTAGILTFVANASGDVRIDVVEVEVVYSTLVSDVRDIYDDATATFNPTNVAKQKAARLNYRIRNCTPAAGYSSASGWLPLAIAIVPSGAVNYSECSFYDVRPLMSDRTDWAGADVINTGRLGTGKLRGSATLAKTSVLYGLIEADGQPLPTANTCGPYRVGGFMRSTSPMAGGGSLDFDGAGPFVGSTFSQAIGFSYVADECVQIAAYFPHGLPRWVKYSDDPATTSGIRVPWGPRGILLIDNIDVVTSSGWTSAALPVEFGLVGTHPGRVIFAGITNSVLMPGTFVDGWCEFPNATIDATVDAQADGQQSYKLVKGTDIPACARRVRLHLVAVYTGAVADAPDSDVQVALAPTGDLSNPVSIIYAGSFNSPSGGTDTIRVTCDGNLFQDTLAPTETTAVFTQTDMGTLTAGSSKCFVLGWQL